jgi:hypothetical protein
VELEDLVRKALSASPSDRQASAIEMQRGLLAIARSESVTSLASFSEEEPPSTSQPLWLPPSSSPAA